MELAQKAFHVPYFLNRNLLQRLLQDLGANLAPASASQPIGCPSMCC